MLPLQALIRGTIIAFNLFCLMLLPVCLVCSLSFDLLLKSIYFLKAFKLRCFLKDESSFDLQPQVPGTFVYMPHKLLWDINNENSASIVAVKIKGWGGARGIVENTVWKKRNRNKLTHLYLFLPWLHQCIFIYKSRFILFPLFSVT